MTIVTVCACCLGLLSVRLLVGVPCSRRSDLQDIQTKHWAEGGAEAVDEICESHFISSCDPLLERY